MSRKNSRRNRPDAATTLEAQPMPVETEIQPVAAETVTPPIEPDSLAGIVISPTSKSPVGDFVYGVQAGGNIVAFPMPTSEPEIAYIVPAFPGYRFPVPAEKVVPLDILKTDPGPLQTALLKTLQTGVATVVYSQEVDGMGRGGKKTPVVVILAAREWCEAAE